MADVNTRRTGRGGGGGTLLLVLLLLVVVVLVGWLVMRGSGEDADVQVNVPRTEAPDIDVPENVDVEVKTSGDAK